MIYFDIICCDDIFEFLKVISTSIILIQRAARDMLTFSPPKVTTEIVFTNIVNQLKLINNFN